MANIPTTDIGTSRPVSICKGMPLIPEMLNLKLGVDGVGTMWTFNPTLLAWQFDFNAGYSYFFGLCGPGWGICMNIEGSTSGNDVNLTVSKDEFAAGLILGALVGLKFNMKAQKLDCVTDWHWWGPSVSCGWFSQMNFPLTLNLDIIKALYAAYKKWFGSEPPIQPPDKEPVISNPFGIQSYGISDYQIGTFAKNNGFLRANPFFSVPINIWNYLANTDVAIAALNTALKNMNIKLSFGPAFGIAFPVNVQMQEVHLDAVPYTVTNVSGSTVTGTTAALPPAGATVNNIRVVFSESPGVDVYFGFFASVTAFEVFSLSWKTGWDVLRDLFHVSPSLGPYTFSVVPTDQGVISKACDACGVNNGLHEVVFE